MSEVNVTDRDGVRWIELDRPSSKNGLTVEVNKQIIAAFVDIETRDDLRAAVLGGSNGNFCSGLDLKEALKRGPVQREQAEADMREYFHGMIRAVRNVGVPVIAAVDGAAAGYGCDLALACDIRVISERARFGEVFVRRGLMPDGGGTFVLPRMVGIGHALEMMFTGDMIDAERAIALGIANRIVPSVELADHVWSFAARLAKGPPRALAAIKRAVYDSLGGTFDQALEREVEGQMGLISGPDFIEAITAFLQKRDPEFE